MKTLLVNGCSFGEIWNPSEFFTESIGCDTVVNISKVGTSFQRSTKC